MIDLIVNSDIVIEILRARDQIVVNRWYRLGAGSVRVACSAITVAEVWQGVRPQEHQQVEAIFRLLISIPVDHVIARRAGDYLRQYRPSQGVDLGDALIAATAVAHHAFLWTRNRKHYPMSDIVLL